MEKNQSHPSFLTEESEVESAFTSIDWLNHPLGSPDRWPSALHISLNIIFHSDTPMILFWGSDLFCFYNEAFIPSLDTADKHPEAMGKMVKNVWPESWGALKSSIEQVLSDEAAVSYEDYLLPVFYNNISLSPVKNEKGNVGGILAIFSEAISAVKAKQELKKAYEEKKHILESITDGFYEINEHWIIIHWNREAEKLLGLKQDDILGKNIWEAFPEGKKLKFYPEYEKTMKERIPTSFEEYYEPWGKWFNFNVYPSRKGISVYFKDITEQRRLQLINERTEEISGVAGWELDLSTEEVFLTPKAYDIYGLPGDTPLNLELNKELFDKKSLDKIDKALQQAINHQKSYEIELNLNPGKEENRIVKIHGFPVTDRGKVTKLYGTLEDVTQEKQEKKKLNEAIRKLKAAQKIAKLGYWTHNIVENKSDWSEEVYNIWEVDPKAFTPTFESMLETIHPEDREIFMGDADAAFPGQDYYDSEHRIITPDGTVKWILERITLHRDENGTPRLLEGIAQDITEKKKQEEEILQSLQEKETLLAEVHHRVKNNLAVVSSIVQLQSYEEENEDIKEKLMDTVVRIVSMASIHEHLYQSHSFSKLDLSENLKNLISKIIETFQVDPKISLDFKLDRVQLNINQAIPCSLIVNEVITNIIKYAFKGKQRGKVTLALTEKNHRIELSIIDNGVGLPENFNLAEKKTLGVRLIDTLAKQLEATYSYNSLKKGTSFSLQFEKSEIKGSGSANI